MSEPENNQADEDDPPPLSIINLPKRSDLPRKSKHWSDGHLPVDILLLTVEDCEFLACYHYLRNSFKSYHKSLGHVFFGNMGDEEEPLKVALVMSSSGPGGSQTVVRNAVTQLRPKATFSVGFCSGLNHEKTKLGDVVVSSMLATDAYKTPVGRDIANFIRNATDGWEAPLQSPELREVKVHRDGVILSCPDLVSAEQQHKLHTEAMAVEMEGKGIFAAAHDMKLEWVVVKGVSDFDISSRPMHESWKTFACIMAASVVSNMLSDPVVFKEWPHYGEDDTCSSQDAKRRKLMTSDLAEPFNLVECQKQLQTFYNTMNKVKIVPWDQSSAVHINDIYTKLSWVRDDRKPSGVTQEELKDSTDILNGDEHHSKPKRILVCGRPGIGKSTFCQKTAFDWSQQMKEVLLKFDLVLCITLRDVCNLHDIRDVLRASKLLAGDGEISIDSLYDYILQNQEKVLLILDGYDEYSCAGKQSPVRDIWEGTLLRDCHVILTTRDARADELKCCSHVQFKINGFNSEYQVKTFASKFLKGEKDVQEFVKYLKEKNLMGMAEIPLLLLMLCLIWKEKHRGLLTSRANIFTTFIQTLLDHMIEKDADSEQFKTVDDYKEELCKLGKLAFDALLRDSLFFHVSELPDDIFVKKLIEAGLFQILNLSSLNPAKGVYFIHKSIQEFLAAWYLKEELLSGKDVNTTYMSKIDSFEKTVKMVEVFKFACELSGEKACTIVNFLGMMGKKEGLTEYTFTDIPSIEDLSKDQRQFVTFISHCFFCCTAEKRQGLYSKFLSYVGGVLRTNVAKVGAKLEMGKINLP